MGGVMAKTVHPACALVGYTIITALVFAGLAASPFDMFVAVGVPTCMAGTTSTPYPFTLASGTPVPSTGPNAKDATSQPFCSTDALFNSYRVRFWAYGYLGSAQGSTNLWNIQQFQSINLLPFCFKKSNGTCPSFSDLGVNTVKVTTPALAPTNSFQLSEYSNFVNAGGAQSLTQYNNYPITFAAGSALPVASPALDASKTYYIRNFNSASGPLAGLPTFQIAADTTSPPLTFTPNANTDPITVTVPALGTCATQQNVQPSGLFNDANVNADGTLKTGSCGYCLTQPQQVGVLAVPGLCGTTITLLLIIELMMCAPFIRKMGFFRILVIVVSVLCMIFLIAAVASAATTLYQVAACQLQTDLSQAQFMPSPINVAAFSGYTPSSGGVSLNPAGGRGIFNAFNPLNGGYQAAYYKPLLIPSGGSVLIIIAIVFLFLFTIVFAIKTDWTAVSSSAADSSQMMTPH